MPPATRTPPDFSVAFYLRQLLPKSNVFIEAMRLLSLITQSQTMGQSARQDQPGIGYQAVIAESDLDAIRVIAW